jgi:hypothetical protein
LGIARGIWESATALAESSVRVDPLPTPESLNLTATELELFGGVDGAYRMRARHDFSNYDLLILTLGPDPWDRLYWQAIRQRVDQMIAYAIERKSPTATACA